MDPVKSICVHNGIFIPRGIISKFDLVYDSEFKIVPDSQFLRGNNLCQNVSKAPFELPNELKYNIKYIKNNLVFLGRFEERHYGHWLIDGVSRLWYLLNNDVNKFRYPTSKTYFAMIRRYRNKLFYRKTLHWLNAPKAFGIDSKLFLYTSKPLRSNKIVVPQRSMHARYNIDPNHLKVTKHIAKFVLNNVIPPFDPRPVYLSRTKLKNAGRKIIGEKAIENFCLSKGFRIVFSEKMSLLDQIMMFNSHDTFVGFAGSAFHSLLLRLTDRNATCVYLYDDRNHTNLDLIDNLTGNNSIYIDCCRVIKESSKSRETLLVDSKKAITALSKYNFF